jgi:hypothetical protein
MKAEFHDLQDQHSALEGRVLETPKALTTLLESLRDRQPFCCELLGDNASKLTLGIGPQHGFAQYSSVDGAPPYFLAVSPLESSEAGFVEFLAGDTFTPISLRFCVSFEAVMTISIHFLETGNRSLDFLWEEI